MRRAAAPRFLIIAAATVALTILLVLIVGRIGGPGEGMNPEALRHIELENRKAAIKAAAIQRAESEALAEAADREAKLRDSGNAAAELTRFESVNEASGR